VGRAARRKAAARALRPPPDIAGLVAALRGWEASLGAQVPGWWQDMDALRLARPVPWPQWCLVPMAAAYAIVERAGWLGGHSYDPSLISAVAACYAWCQGRGVYVFEPELAEALLGSEGLGEVPAEIFCQLPEWGPVVVAPPALGWPEDMPAFICHLEWDANHHRRELRLLVPVVSAGMVSRTIAIPVHIDAGTVADAVAAALHTAEGEARKRGVLASDMAWWPSDLAESMTRQIVAPALSLIAYLCSVGSDVADPDHPGSLPGGHRTRQPTTDPQPVNRFSVGYRVATAIRAARLVRQAGETSEPTGRKVVPHLRRAHWHHYWVGPRSGPDRHLELRWVLPTMVGASQPSQVTVRPVRAARPKARP
jgi:hypothetical protein